MSLEAVSSVDFAESLLAGKARGYVVCVTPLRFSKLSPGVATTYAELETANRYPIFESADDATAALSAISASDRLGYIYEVRAVWYVVDTALAGGPKLNVDGAPFGLLPYCVDRLGRKVVWPHGGQFVWYTPPTSAGEILNRIKRTRKGFFQRLRDVFGFDGR